MRLNKKRSWSTALGDPPHSPELGSRGSWLLPSDPGSPIATAAASGTFHDTIDVLDPESEPSDAVSPGDSIHPTSHFIADAKSFEDWKGGLNRESEQDLGSDEDIPNKTPIGTSSLSASSTPSTEGGETAVDTHGPSTVCYGQVRDVYVSYIFSTDLRNPDHQCFRQTFFCFATLGQPGP